MQEALTKRNNFTQANLNASVAKLDAAFARDIAAAKKINSPAELETKPGLVSQIMSQFFYAQLSARPQAGQE